MELSNVSWRKSSYSADNGGHCVELGTFWRKSSHSADNGGNCVELAEAWRKSSHGGDNGGDCVELAEAWRKSSHSDVDGGHCVELSGPVGYVAIRDSKDPEGGVLLVSRQAFRHFTEALKTS